MAVSNVRQKAAVGQASTVLGGAVHVRTELLGGQSTAVHVDEVAREVVQAGELFLVIFDLGTDVGVYTQSRQRIGDGREVVGDVAQELQGLGR